MRKEDGKGLIRADWPPVPDRDLTGGASRGFPHPTTSVLRTSACVQRAAGGCDLTRAAFVHESVFMSRLKTMVILVIMTR
jgi:hypothetical protein